jgi:hypothetical protein
MRLHVRIMDVTCLVSRSATASTLPIVDEPVRRGKRQVTNLVNLSPFVRVLLQP